MVSHTAIVRPDGMVEVPADGAQPGDRVVVRVERPVVVDLHDPGATRDPKRLVRLTARSSEQQEAFRRQIDSLVDRLAPMLKAVPDHGELLYDENGLPK